MLPLSPDDSSRSESAREAKEALQHDYSMNIGNNNLGIANLGPNATNIQIRIEGDFAYQIGRLPRHGASRHHEPWREQPSQLLLARHQVVPFTGREDDLRELEEWRDDLGGPRTALRLLHGPGGQGKTRLALKFAAVTPDDWDVWEATTRTASPAARAASSAPRSPGTRALIVVDYAERWPVSALTALVQDLISRPGERRRVLLVARSAGSWWMSLLDDLRVMEYDVTAMSLDPLEGGVTGDRHKAYLTARSSFAKALGLSDTDVVEMPIDLDLSHRLFGLTLTVHMAALVAVDAYVRGLRPPNDPAALSAYLLDRERAHWAKLHQAGRLGVGDDVMAQVVYTATLTGRMSYADGLSALERVGVESSRPVGSVLKDHAVVYPGDGYLEPLYPDRLGEDFLALATPGHKRSYQPDPWTTTATFRLLGLSGPVPVWTRHALTVLIETARRWPHVASSQLYPVLVVHPQVALEAGGAALAALSNLDNIDFGVLKAIAACLPERHSDLDVGMAALTQRLGDHLLTSVKDLAERAQIYRTISNRMHNAGLHDQGFAPAEEAVRLYRKLARDKPTRYEESLAWALNGLGIHAHITRRDHEALAASQEAADIIQKLVAEGRTDLEPALGRVLANLSVRKPLDPERRLAIAQQAVLIGRRWATEPAAKYLELAGALENLAFALDEHGRSDEAIAVTREAATLRRDQAESAPEVYGPDLVRTLDNLIHRLAKVNDVDEVLRVNAEAIDFYRRLAAGDSLSWEPGLAAELFALGARVWAAKRYGEAVTAFTEAVDMFRRLAAADPDRYEHNLADSLHNLGISYARREGVCEEALAVTSEAVAVYRRLAVADAALCEPRLAKSLLNLGIFQAALGRHEDAIEATTEGVALYRRLASEAPDEFEALLAEAVDFLRSLLDKSSN